MITEGQNLITMEDINAKEMENENKESDIIIPVPDLNSSMATKDINGDHDISEGQNLITMEDINAKEMENENKESDIIIPVPDLNSSMATKDINGDHDR
ncbi:uncharacterized protein LOC132943759 [Metopolophium dirhodum]|uniref:uncharacterized protein LOC132943759 n=1 Tax=Metopolophium dirhodum TaxID=44670 RepID=UPI00299015CD|nr:uncharacterized protein LOC132943759 [Metopolophium dirhodum]